ncbi:MAG: hypothetical protein RSF13_01440 [Clostridiales bacterium]
MSRAYCRVSTALEKLFFSLESRLLYYTTKIVENQRWINVGFVVKRLLAEI